MESLLKWLLEGDPAIAYQTERDLLGAGSERLKILQKRLETEGWAKAFLEKRDPKTGLWANGLYSPKWISTTYAMLDLKNCGIDPQLEVYQKSARLLLEGLWKIPEKKRERWQDLCICGMLLNLCCYGKIQHKKLEENIDYILDKQFADGAWNCRWEFDHDHSSLHTTINILEGLLEYKKNGYRYRLDEIERAVQEAHEFILMHRLFLSDRTGDVIDPKMTMLSYPGRWRYDVLRCLDYFQAAELPYDARMEDAFALIEKKRRKDDTWPVQQKYTGRVYFDMEQTGKSSRWNTLRVLRVYQYYGRTLSKKVIG